MAININVLSTEISALLVEELQPLQKRTSQLTPVSVWDLKQHTSGWSQPSRELSRTLFMYNDLPAHNEWHFSNGS